MRKIKFKIWDNIQEKYINSNIAFGPNGEIFPLGSGYELEHFNGRYEVYQFTGMLDKDDNEIYEGDYVQLDIFDKPILRVKWHEYTGQFRFFDKMMAINMNLFGKEHIHRLYCAKGIE